MLALLLSWTLLQHAIASIVADINVLSSEVAHLQSQLERNPNDGEFHSLLGITLLRRLIANPSEFLSADVSRAYRHLKRALELNAESGDVEDWVTAEYLADWFLMLSKQKCMKSASASAGDGDQNRRICTEALREAAAHYQRAHEACAASPQVLSVDVDIFNLNNKQTNLISAL